MTEIVKGHSQLEKVIALINENKRLEERILQLLDTYGLKDVDPRWLAIARTHIEQGFMALNRAVAKPERVEQDGMDYEQALILVREEMARRKLPQ